MLLENRKLYFKIKKTSLMNTILSICAHFFLIINDPKDKELALYIVLIYLVKIIMYSNDNIIKDFTSKTNS